MACTAYSLNDIVALWIRGKLAHAKPKFHAVMFFLFKIC